MTLGTYFLGTCFLYGETRESNSCLEGCVRRAQCQTQLWPQALRRDLVFIMCNSLVTVCLATKCIIFTICRKLCKGESKLGHESEKRYFSVVPEALLPLSFWLGCQLPVIMEPRPQCPRGAPPLPPRFHRSVPLSLWVSPSLSLPHTLTQAQTPLLSSWPFFAVGWETGGKGGPGYYRNTGTRNRM